MSWSNIQPGGIRWDATKVEVWYDGDLSLVTSGNATEFRDLLSGTVGNGPFGVWFGWVRFGRACTLAEAQTVAVQLEADLRNLGVNTSL